MNNPNDLQIKHPLPAFIISYSHFDKHMIKRAPFFKPHDSYMEVM